MEALLTEKELAPLLSVSLPTLRAWRLKRQGPGFVKLGSAVRYRPSDIQDWIASCPTGGTRVSGGGR